MGLATRALPIPGQEGSKDLSDRDERIAEIEARVNRQRAMASMGISQATKDRECLLGEVHRLRNALVEVRKHVNHNCTWCQENYYVAGKALEGE